MILLQINCMKKELLWTSYSKLRPKFSLFYFIYLRPVCSRNISFKKFEILPMSVVMTPDEIYDTYVKINEEIPLDINVHNNLIQKAKFQTLSQLRPFIFISGTFIFVYFFFKLKYNHSSTTTSGKENKSQERCLNISV